jgi:hypothetical protein
MPVPTQLHVSIGDILVMTVRLDTANGKSIPDLSILGHRNGVRTAIATARLDSGCGVWDVTVPSGEKFQMRYPVLDIEGPSTQLAYWRAVRRAADLFAADVLRDAANASGIWT